MINLVVFLILSGVSVFIVYKVAKKYLNRTVVDTKIEKIKTQEDLIKRIIKYKMSHKKSKYNKKEIEDFLKGE